MVSSCGTGFTTSSLERDGLGWYNLEVCEEGVAAPDPGKGGSLSRVMFC